MIITVWPFLIAVIGLLIYAFASAKPAEIGKWLFIIGTYFVVAQLAGKTVRLLGGG